MRGNLKWYAARLAAMSPVEIAHRVIEMARKKKLARLNGGWSAFHEKSDNRLAALPLLRERLAAAAAFTVDEVLTRSRFLGRTHADLFNTEESPPFAAWFLDPVSGRHWPDAATSAFAVDVRSTSAEPRIGRPYGDVKFVWEPNRLQILHPLAAIAAAGGPEKEAAQRFSLNILQSWMQANPPYRGVNWTSGIELALRLVSITLMVATLDGVAAGDRSAISAFVRAHAHMLALLPSLHSSANNHRVAEGLGLYLAGCLCPELQHENQRGQEILEAETLLQIYPDGVGGEQSPSYQAFTMELIAFGALIAQMDGKPFSDATIDRLNAGADFLRALQSGEGQVPAIGDDDEGRVLLAPSVDEPLYVASVANAIDGLCGRDVAGGWRPGYFRERMFRAPLQQIAVSQLESVRVFADGGYTILRRKIAGRDVHLTFDHGPLGYLSLAAHGHADVLAIWMSIDGQPVFVDAGTWLYHSGEDARRKLRSSQAHNTLSLQGLSQSEPSAAFSFANKADAQRCEPDVSLGGEGVLWAMAGEHDGYLKRARVKHRRDIIGSANGFVIADRLIGAQQGMAVSIFFLCHPSIALRREGDCILISRSEGGGERALIKMRPPASFSVALCGSVNTYSPYSPRFGDLRDTAGILLEGSLAAQPCLTAFDFETA